MKALVLLNDLRLLRIGGYKGNLRFYSKTLHSDTIYSAILSKAFSIFDENTTEDFAKHLTTSSLLFVENKTNSLVVYAPKYIPPHTDDSNIKSMKKAMFIKINDLPNWFKGEDAESIVPYSIQENPRVALSRTDNSSAFFWTSFVYIDIDSYTPVFLAEFPDKYERMFKASVKALGDDGLGGQRGKGAGRFVPKFESFEDFEKEDPKVWILQSLYRPKKEEYENVESGWFKTLSKGGWIFQNGKALKKPRVNFISEGSVFKFKPTGFNGKVIQDDFEYFVQGRAISIGVKVNE